MTERRAALGAGALGAIVSALPAVPRVVEAGAGATLGFLALAGGTALVLGPALVFAGAVRSQARGIRVPLLGLALAAAPLSFLAEVLKRGTHHRPLGAATYAVLALAIVTGSLVAAWRLVRFSESVSPERGRFVLGLLALSGVASIGFVLARALGSAALVPHVLDGLRALATATLFHLLLRLPRLLNAARRIGAPLWVAVVVAGFVAARGVTRAAVHTAAPVLGGPLAWF